MPDFPLVTPAPHHPTHEDTGSDEISLTKLEGDDIRFVPQVADVGPVGSVFYKIADDHLYLFIP
jgi:hypothetical protein